MLNRSVSKFCAAVREMNVNSMVGRVVHERKRVDDSTLLQPGDGCLAECNMHGFHSKKQFIFRRRVSTVTNTTGVKPLPSILPVMLLFAPWMWLLQNCNLQRPSSSQKTNYIRWKNTSPLYPTGCTNFRPTTRAFERIDNVYSPLLSLYVTSCLARADFRCFAFSYPPPHP